ncbi:MAG: ammonia-forming cytochrome c nitrite reductase subunit c552 [Micrococcales bacterium]|nr:ammonia-forming cytochrome c nitrite reductase subunit c552 [Micrococcales bacterium]
MSETDKAPDPTVPKRRIWPFVAVAAVAAVVTAGLAFLIGSISDNKSNAYVGTYDRVVALDGSSYAASEWGKNFPVQYDAFRATAQLTSDAHVPAWQPISEEERTTLPAVAPDAPAPDPVTYDDARSTLPGKYGDTTPANSNLSSLVTPSKLVEDPRLKTLWNGYAFAKDYRHLRGHEYGLIDQQQTLRVLALADGPAPQPGACSNCHASLPPIVDQLAGTSDGTGLNEAGWAAMNVMPYTELANTIESDHLTAVSCIDCHDPETMKLRITRPALVQAMKDLKGDQSYDVNKDATNQELRALVCAQCHVEYYFKGPEKTLTFPWHNGTDINGAWTYYQNVEITGADGTVTTGFTDFKSGISGASVVKAQHPEYEAWDQSVHAANGVTCADCHMYYVREGGQKVSNHQVASPMASPDSINASCGTCHPGSTEALQNRVTSIQSTFTDSRNRVMDAVAGEFGLINSLKAAQDDGVDPDRIALAQQYANFANFYVDYAYSENSYGFHAPDYFQRILNQSLDAARNGQLALLGVPADRLVPLKDLNADRSSHHDEATEG